MAGTNVPQQWCPRCGEALRFWGTLRRRPHVLWWRCPACAWLGQQWRGAESPLEGARRYEGREADCPWCGEEDFVAADAGEWIHDICVACGRFGGSRRRE
ncbi:hypothetical protein ACWGDE_27650 [Streptomyces sp. NPDC054956]